jgi:hypothetical protein
MAVKTTGAEFKRFYADKAFWPHGTWHEDEGITIDGQPFDYASGDILDEVSDSCVMTLAHGCVFRADSSEWGSFEGHFKKWRKAQTTTSLVIECPKELEAVVRAAIKAAGAKVL